MKVILSRLELVRLIGNLQNVISNKPAIPILSNLLMEAKGNLLILRVTNLTVSIQTYMEAVVSQEGSITLPGRRFFQLIRELTTSEIEMTLMKDTTACIRCGTSEFHLNGIHYSEFPTFPNLQSDQTFHIKTETFKEMLSKSMFAAAKEDPRHVLNGVLMQIEKNQATFVGTDGKRLAKITTTIESDKEMIHNYLIPLKGVEEILRSLEGINEVKVTLMSDKIGIECGSTLLITQLLCEEYPDVERIIPKECPHTVSLHREELMTLLKQVSLFTTDKNHSVYFSFSRGELTLKGQSNDFGIGIVSMPADYSGEPFKIAFNPFYFHDILRHCSDETINVATTTPYEPGLITDSTTAQFVLMPMRLPDV